MIAVRIAWRMLFGMAFRFVEILGQFFPADSWGCKVRGAIHKPFLKKCGRNFQVALGAKLDHLRGIEVGNDVYIGPGTWICGLRGGVVFGDEVMIGPLVTMVSSNHTFHKQSARFAQGQGGRIEIGYGTWVAGGVTVTAGVTIGRGCLLAAGAVVTKDVEDESVVGGIPAKVIGTTSNRTLMADKQNLK